MEALMLSLEEFAVRMRVEVETVRIWADEGWLVPRAEDSASAFSEIDLARAQLILDLKNDLGVNDEGIGVILDLLDQVHGLRQALRNVGRTLVSMPESAQGGSSDGPGTADDR
jgi:chaperone modulatory protein CbpM